MSITVIYNNDEGTVTIPQTYYTSLCKDVRKLQALENAGVDNWEWYGDAMEELDDE